MRKVNIVCPIGFLVGMVGSIVLLIKKKKMKIRILKNKMRPLVIIIIILAIVFGSLFLLKINLFKDNWNLQTCNSECIHRGYDIGSCRWPSEMGEEDVEIGSCVILNSRHCGNKGLCNCYCENETSIGGERDEHGCLGAAGYTWNETELSCVREWLDGETRYQVTNFYTCESAGYPMMESYPRQCKAPNGDVFTEEISEESKYCEIDSDCIVFGEDGDCNCGCYNKDALPTSTGGACFCAAPTSCECVENLCEGIFE